MTKHIKIRDHSEIPKFFTGCVELENSKEWWQNGKRHREDGPAVEYNDGFKAWHLDGIYVVNNALHYALEDNYVVLERGIPTDDTFGNLKITQAKLLTADGTMFVYDNLPGDEIIV